MTDVLVIDKETLIVEKTVQCTDDPKIEALVSMHIGYHGHVRMRLFLNNRHRCTKHRVRCIVRVMLHEEASEEAANEHAVEDACVYQHVVCKEMSGKICGKSQSHTQTSVYSRFDDTIFNERFVDISQHQDLNAIETAIVAHENAVKMARTLHGQESEEYIEASAKLDAAKQRRYETNVSLYSQAQLNRLYVTCTLEKM